MSRPSPRQVIADVLAVIPKPNAFSSSQIAANVLRALERNGYEITEILTYTESRPGGRDRRKLG